MGVGVKFSLIYLEIYLVDWFKKKYKGIDNKKKNKRRLKIEFFAKFEDP